MRLSDLLGATVSGRDGQVRGVVIDVRLAQVGPVRGALAQLEVESLIVSIGHTGSLFGYERDVTRGPWLVKAVVRWLHRQAFVLPWPDVASADAEGHRITVR